MEKYNNNSGYEDENDEEYQIPPKWELNGWGDITDNEENELLEYIDDGILVDKSILLIAGPPKKYKSILATQMGIILASENKDWFGHLVDGGCIVLNFQAEENKYTLYKKLKIMEKGITWESNYQDLDTFATNIKLDIMNPTHYSYLRDEIRRLEAEIVIFDPLVKFHTVEDENNNPRMDNVMDEFHRLNEECNCTSIIVHHSSKNIQGGVVSRGASSIFATADTQILVNPVGDRIDLKFDLRHGAHLEPIKLKMNPNTLWLEEITKTSNEVIDFVLDELQTTGANGIMRNELQEKIAEKFKFDIRTASNEIVGYIKSGLIKTDNKKRNMRLFSPKQGIPIAKN